MYEGTDLGSVGLNAAEVYELFSGSNLEKQLEGEKLSVHNIFLVHLVSSETITLVFRFLEKCYYLITDLLFSVPLGQRLSKRNRKIPAEITLYLVQRLSMAFHINIQTFPGKQCL